MKKKLGSIFLGDCNAADLTDTPTIQIGYSKLVIKKLQKMQIRAKIIKSLP